MSVFLRAFRTAIPVIALVLSGVLQNNPNTIWLLPVLATLGKGLRDTYPNSTFVGYLPF